MNIDIAKLIRALLCQPEPVSIIQPAGTISMEQAAIICNDKLNEIGSTADIFLPDSDMKFYRMDDVVNFSGLSEVSCIQYAAETHDCDDFAAKLFGQFAGLVWTNAHALNWFIDENGIFWFIEPQNKKISQTLESWQGSQIRFLIGR